MIEQGQVFNFDFGSAADNRQAGVRPAVVVQTDHLNELETYSLTIVVAVSTKGRQSPSHVRIEPTPENGFSETSFAKCEQVFTVPKDRLGRLRGRLSQEDLSRVKDALAIVLGL